MGKIIKEDDILGVRYWALVAARPTTIPRFEVYRYLGRNDTGDLFWFQNIRNHKTMPVRIDELNTYYFKPFLIDHKKIQKYIKKIDPGYKF